MSSPPLLPLDTVPPAVAPGAPSAPPQFSVVIPVHNGGAEFERCLEALDRLGRSDFEVLVVDDASSDGSGVRAAGRGLRVVRQERRRGPAAARNLGARSAGGVFLFFLDADCELHPDALDRAAAVLGEEPALDALFGSYDDRPSARGVVSQFKNLFHHWTHLRGDEQARTFWAGCGAVRRERFLAVGGFDERRYPEPSIEDIELGYRLSESGSRIRLVKQMQVRHLKRWTLANLLHTDFVRRGVPWTELLLERRDRADQLNVGGRERWVVLAGAIGLSSLPFALLHPALLAVSALLLSLLVASTWSFYVLMLRRAGVVAALAALPLHALYCCSCCAAFGVGLLRTALRPGKRLLVGA